jgi:hypothetical protein
MQNFRNFSKALAQWRDYGGAMHVVQKDGRPLFQVGEYEEIEKIVGNTVKQQTIEALRVGGLSSAQITKEMVHWMD